MVFRAINYYLFKKLVETSNWSFQIMPPYLNISIHHKKLLVIISTCFVHTWFLFQNMVALKEQTRLKIILQAVEGGDSEEEENELEISESREASPDKQTVLSDSLSPTQNSTDKESFASTTISTVPTTSKASASFRINEGSPYLVHLPIYFRIVC